MRTKFKNNIKYLFSFPLIFTNLDINVNDSEPMTTQLAYGVFLLSLVDPKFKGIIKYFKGISLTFIIIDGLLCLTCLILLVIFFFIIK